MSQMQLPPDRDSTREKSPRESPTAISYAPDVIGGCLEPNGAAHLHLT
jgi:hypothetical protein